ncbi:MAG TPA: hypothetical protein VN581_06815 [Patescibacteria group bacterium]|nr:hypothetical protein [Patescibacteria group bacterium]
MNLRSVPLAALALLLAVGPLAAQTVVNMPFNNGPVTHTFNPGPDTAFFSFHDNGGPAANYSINSSATTSIVTFVGPPGSNVRAVFSAFATEAGWDALYVFDGASTASPMIASANGAPVSCPGTTAAGGWWGTTAPSNAGANIVESTGNALTFQFCSDGSVTMAGWDAIVSLTTEANLALNLVASPSPAVAGGNLTYVATLTNNGPDDAQDAAITLNLPAGVNFVSASASGSGSCVGTNPVTCTWAGTTASGQSLIATVVTNIPAGTVGQLDASASGTSLTSDLDPSDNSATVSVLASAPALPVPALDARTLALLVLAMFALGAFVLQRRE